MAIISSSSSAPCRPVRTEQQNIARVPLPLEDIHIDGGGKADAARNDVSMRVILCFLARNHAGLNELLHKRMIGRDPLQRFSVKIIQAGCRQRSRQDRICREQARRPASCPCQRGLVRFRRFKNGEVRALNRADQLLNFVLQKLG